ncbi:MAG TPA: ribonuclease HI [Thermoanaerobaculia bacterium]|nr:ribonuclease HI [Thermoanaerobaculia bacterium]
MTVRSQDVTRVYTDGGASPNPGPGGWAVVVLRPGAEPEEHAGGEPRTTNNRMELTAAIRALEALRPGEPAELYVDSQYVRQGITAWLPTWVRRGWRKADGKPVENEDLWRRLASLAAGRELAWRWVRGHAGDRWNERADQLAAAEIRRLHGDRPGEDGAPAADWEVHLRISADRGGGGWAAAVRGPEDDAAAGGGRVLTGAATGTSGNRLEILAAAEVLESLPPGASVVVHTPSDYLRHGASRWLPAWRRRGWIKKDGGPVANRDAWERLARALERRRVRWPDPRGAEAEEGGAELEKMARAARRGGG